MEEVLPTGSPYSSFVVIHDRAGGVPSWLLPLITVVLFVGGQVATYFYFRHQLNKEREERSHLTLRELSGRLSAAGYRLQGMRSKMYPASTPPA